ncbi:hypothetical protein [Radicibacter daui]|uniref:hypothetical protein n=1 Tax=Radicibacter daui TaxID=3064829 RepID=UPI004046FCE9
MTIAVPTAFIRNPATDVRMVASDADGPRQIVVSAYSVLKGFSETVFDRTEDAAFAAVLDLAAGREDVLDGLSPDIGLALWSSGLIILPPEKAAPFAPPRFTASPAAFAADGFALLQDCLTPTIADILAAYYREQVQSGSAWLTTDGIDRWQLHNDPAGRVVQRALLPAVEALVDVPVMPSYSFASLYREGASLPVHRDREQCEYTLSLLIDHQPLPADGISPWAIQVHARPGAEPVDCYQSLRGGILFRGRDLPHGRKALAADETCWTLLVHYVDAGFEGPLD